MKKEMQNRFWLAILHFLYFMILISETEDIP